MKLVVDMALLVDDSTSLQLMCAKQASRRTDPPYHLLQYTNCFSESPWHSQGKYLYRVLSSFVDSSHFVLYNKCPEKYSRWMRRERELWCYRELGHNLHPLLFCDSKKQLRAYIKTNCVLVSCNENLINYWMKYSNRCVLYKISSLDERIGVDFKSLEFVSKREELIARCRQLHALDDDIIEGDCDGGVSSRIKISATDNEGNCDKMDDNAYENNVKDNADRKKTKMGGDDDADVVKIDDNVTLYENVYAGEKIADGVQKCNVNSGMAGQHDVRISKNMNTVAEWDDMGINTAMIDVSDSISDDDSYDSFCETHADSLHIIRNLALLCGGFIYNYAMSADSGGSANGDRGSGSVNGLKGAAICFLPIHVGYSNSTRWGTSTDSSRVTVDDTIADRAYFLGFHSSAFCQQIGMRVLNIHAQTRTREADRSGALDEENTILPVVPETSFVNCDSSSQQHNTCSVELQYDISQALRVLCTCPPCFAAALTRCQQQLFTAGAGWRRGYDCGGSDCEPPHPLDQEPAGLMWVQRFLRSSVLPFGHDTGSGSVAPPASCLLCSPSVTLCPASSSHTHTGIAYSEAIPHMRSFMESIIQHSLSVLVTNYCMHVTPYYALLSSCVPFRPSTKSPGDGVVEKRSDDDVGCGETIEMESAFANVKHVCLYQQSKEWKHLIYAATKTCVQEHKFCLSHQWDRFGDESSSNSSGDEMHNEGGGNGGGVGAVETSVKDTNSTTQTQTQGKRKRRCMRRDARTQAHAQGPMMSYCRDEAHSRVQALLQEAVLVVRDGKEDKVSGDGSGSRSSCIGSKRTNPYCCRFKGLALHFSADDYQALSPSFRLAGLWHLLPLWAVCSGVLAVVDYLHRRGKWERRRFSHSDEWQDAIWLSLALVEDLLMWKSPVQAPVPTTTATKSSSLGVFEAIHKEMLSSIRYTCWQRRLSLYEMLYGFSSPILLQHVRTAREECGTSDHGWSAAKVHGLEEVAEKYGRRGGVVNASGRGVRGGKRGRGRGLVSKRLKHKKAPAVIAVTDSEGEDEDKERTPTKDAGGGTGGGAGRYVTRDFRGHLMGRSRGRLLYRKFTVAGECSGSGHDCGEEAVSVHANANVHSTDGDGGDMKWTEGRLAQLCSSSVRGESMQVEHFAICRYLSILAEQQQSRHKATCTLGDSAGITTNPAQASSSDCFNNSKCDIARKSNARLVLEPLRHELVRSRQELVSPAGGRKERNREEGEEKGEEGAAAWMARGPGAWVHAVISPPSPAPSSFFSLVAPAPRRRVLSGSSDASAGRTGAGGVKGGAEVAFCCAPRTWLGSHCEGTVWLTLLVMLMYEEIYETDLPFAMMNRPFLNRPVDFLPESHGEQFLGSPINCDKFYERRQSAIQQKLFHLRCLSDLELAYEISDRLNLHWGKRLFGVNWDKVDPYFVMSVGWSVGGKRLSIVLDEMLRDPVCYCRGMPDLLFCVAMPLPPSSLAEGGAMEEVQCTCGCAEQDKCFVSEVKSTNDRLSIWQKAWIDLFRIAGIPFEEAHVNWKKKKRNL